MIVPTDDGDEGDANPVEDPEAKPNSVDEGEGHPPEIEEQEEDPSGFLMTNMLQLHWKFYKEDTKQAQLVRGYILGLPAGQIPDRTQVDNSKIIAMHTPREGPDFKEMEEEGGRVPAHNVHAHWLDYL